MYDKYDELDQAKERNEFSKTRKALTVPMLHAYDYQPEEDIDYLIAETKQLSTELAGFEKNKEEEFENEVEARLRNTGLLRAAIEMVACLRKLVRPEDDTRELQILLVRATKAIQKFDPD